MLSENGKVFGMGANRGFEMGLGNSSQGRFFSPVRITALEMYMIVKVAAGSFSGALTSSGETLIWGSGDFGILASPQNCLIDDVKFVDMKLSKQAEGFAAGLDEKGIIFTWGSN